MKATVAIIGLKELEKQIEKVSEAMEKKAGESAFKQAEMVRDRIIGKAPVGPTGNLKRSPIAKRMPKKSGFPPISIAGIDRKIAPHAHLVEFGTSRAPAHPFFRPAIDESKVKVMSNLKEDIKKSVEDAV